MKPAAPSTRSRGCAVANRNVFSDLHRVGCESATSVAASQPDERDLSYYKTLGAALQLEINRLEVKQALAAEVLRTLIERYRAVVADADAGRLGEQDAIKRLDNLANAAFNSITTLLTR
jgi:hypothetical protein